MSAGERGRQKEGRRIGWAQALRYCKMPLRFFEIAGEKVRRAREIADEGAARIEGCGSAQRRQAALRIAARRREHKAGHADDVGVIRVSRQRLSRVGDRAGAV